MIYNNSNISSYLKSSWVIGSCLIGCFHETQFILSLVHIDYADVPIAKAFLCLHVFSVVLSVALLARRPWSLSCGFP